MKGIPTGEPSNRRPLLLAMLAILWIAGVFGWVVVYGEAFIGPKADSAAFIARFVDFR